MIKKYYITWDNVEDYIKSISKKLEHKQYDCIVCAGRGAMVPSRLFSGILNIPVVKYIDYATYTDTTKTKQLTDEEKQHLADKVKDLATGHKNVLLVDDCISTGGTVNDITSLLLNVVESVDIAVLFLNDKAPVIDNVYYYEQFKQDDIWLVFPWEVNDR